MGTKNNPGEFDCYANAEDDEPMFVLLARDEHAPSTVRSWVVDHRSGREIAAGRALDLNEKEKEALRCAVEMERWRRNALNFNRKQAT